MPRRWVGCVTSSCEGAAAWHCIRVTCRHDLEHVVGKWARGTYQSGPGTSWLKIKNPSYSQLNRRAELFEARERGSGRRAVTPPVLTLA